MNRRFHPVGVIVLVVLTAASSVAWAATAEVQIVDTAFKPKAVAVGVGDSVHWSSEGTAKRHNVTQDKGIFFSGALTSGAIDFTVTFTAGTFPYFCKNHGKPGGEGMSGVVRVRPTIVPDPEGLPFTVVWSSGSADTGSRFDVKFRVDAGAWKPWKNDTAATRAVFGQGDKPVKLRSGQTYSFKVRSLEGGAASNWSPVASFSL